MGQPPRGAIVWRREHATARGPGTSKAVARRRDQHDAFRAPPGHLRCPVRGVTGQRAWVLGGLFGVTLVRWPSFAFPTRAGILTWLLSIRNKCKVQMLFKGETGVTVGYCV